MKTFYLIMLILAVPFFWSAYSWRKGSSGDRESWRRMAMLWLYSVIVWLPMNWAMSLIAFAVGSYSYYRYRRLEKQSG